MKVKYTIFNEDKYQLAMYESGAFYSVHLDYWNRDLDVKLVERDSGDVVHHDTYYNFNGCVCRQYIGEAEE